ncbi:MAG: BrnT family toxin [Gammaproteobacteria bacterium]|nr:BrnT family toxin [Gammaproteobacteria bacterium]
MSFEWDDVKNQANIQKHGVSFEEARQIFSAPILTTVDERREYGEVRQLSIGRIDAETLIVVTHTERDGNIRLISARPASRKERQKFHDQVR